MTCFATRTDLSADLTSGFIDRLSVSLSVVRFSRPQMLALCTNSTPAEPSRSTCSETTVVSSGCEFLVMGGAQALVYCLPPYVHDNCLEPRLGR